MDGIDAKSVLLVMLVFWILPDFSASNVAKCSCYSFHGNSSLQQDGREHCKNGTGDLVSMETNEELQFIQNHIQNETTENRGNEWWIGLEGFNENGARKWKWLSNHTDLQTPSHPNLQTVLRNEGNNKVFVTISYNASSNVSLIFNIINSTTYKRNGWICEYKNKDCDSKQTGIVCKLQGLFEAAATSTITTTSTYSTVSTTSKITTTTRPTARTTTTTTTTSTTTSTTTEPTVTETNRTTTTTPRDTTTKTTSKNTPKPMTPKVAKLTSAAPTTDTTTAAMTQRPFFGGFLTTTSAPVRDCLPDPYIVVAITVSVVGGVTVIFFIGLFLFVVCRKNCSKPRKPVEKVEMEEGEYENHL